MRWSAALRAAACPLETVAKYEREGFYHALRHTVPRPFDPRYKSHPHAILQQIEMRPRPTEWTGLRRNWSLNTHIVL